MKRNNGVYIFRYEGQKRPEKVNYNLRLKGRGVSLVKSGRKNIPERRSGMREVQKR